MKIAHFGFLVLLLSFNTPALAGCGKHALYAGCPWDGGRIASHDGRFSIENMPVEAAAGLLERYNHTPNGCTHPADHIIGAYSRYEAGTIFYLHGNILVQSLVMDRVMLRDLLDNKVVVDNRKIKLMSCRNADAYKPTRQTYTMPSFQAD